jgi:kynurenine 3-monooxygenase
MKNQDKHIAIVGSGLVGALMSIFLVRRGYNVSLFERRSDLRKQSRDDGRSINLALSNRGIRALEEIEIMEEVKKIAIPMHGRMMHDPKGNLSFLPYGKKGQFINSISRKTLNEVLLDRAEALGVNLYFEHTCKEIDLKKTEITFEYADHAVSIGRTRHHDATISRISFDAILGADGAFSTVRGAMQLSSGFDYSQEYIEHGYKELIIPSSHGGILEKNALHIWPRESFMMIALPNPDGSFTCTLFYPLEGATSFQSLKNDEMILRFFRETFPDALPQMPTLLQDFHENPTSSLVTIQCYPWAKNKTLLIGDAAHAIVPFFGQGMNSGFEDCRSLNALLDKHNDNWSTAIQEFQELRKTDADAIARLALDNFIEMRDLVADAAFLLRKKLKQNCTSSTPINGPRCIQWSLFRNTSDIPTLIRQASAKKKSWMK